MTTPEGFDICPRSKDLGRAFASELLSMDSVSFAYY